MAILGPTAKFNSRQCFRLYIIVSFPDPTLRVWNIEVGRAHQHVTSRAPTHTYANNHMIAELAEPRIVANVPRPFPSWGWGLGTRLAIYGIKRCAVCNVISSPTGSWPLLLWRPWIQSDRLKQILIIEGNILVLLHVLLRQYVENNEDSPWTSFNTVRCNLPTGFDWLDALVILLAFSVWKGKKCADSFIHATENDATSASEAQVWLYTAQHMQAILECKRAKGRFTIVRVGYAIAIGFALHRLSKPTATLEYIPNWMIAKKSLTKLEFSRFAN